MKAEWLDFMGDMIAPIAILASGGSKASALWMGVGNVFMTKVLGPLGMVAGAAASFLVVTKKLVGEWKNMGMGAAKQLEQLTVQFKPLLGSMALAKKRAQELFNFGKVTPFEFPDVATGGKMLEALTRGALTTNKGLNLVGDAATVAGTSFSEMSQEVGRLYDGLMSGRPVGMVAMRLQELGVISGATRNQLEAMQAANADGAEVWAVAERDIGRFQGAMADAQGTLLLMESTYRDTKAAMQAGFSGGFMEGEKAGLQSSITLMERMTPAAKALGDMFGGLSNAWAKVKAWVVDSVTGWKFFGDAVVVATYAMAAFSGAIVLASGAAIGKFLVGIISSAQAAKQLAVAVGDAAAAEQAGAVITGALTEAKASLVAVSAAVKTGSYAEAGAEVKLAAASTIAAVRTNGLAAAQAILRGALMLTVKAAKFVAVSMWEMAVSIIATPVGAIAAALVVVGGALYYFANKAQKAREELQNLEEASRSVVSTLKQQVAGIRTVADLRKAEGDIVSRLAEAYRELGDAQAKGDKPAEAIARKKIEALKEVQKAARGTGVEKDAATVDREEYLRQAEKAAKKTRENADAGTGEESAMYVAKAQQAEGDRKMAEEKAMVDAEKALEQKQLEARRKIDDDTEQKGAQEAKAAKARTVLDTPYDQWTDTHKGYAETQAKAAADLADAQGKLDAMAKNKAAHEAGVSDIALNGDSELAASKEKLRIYEEMKNAAVDYEDLVKKLGEAKTVPEADAARSRMKSGHDRVMASRAAAEHAGVGGWNAEDRQSADLKKQRILTERNENLDPNAAAERELKVAEAERAFVQAKLDAEEQILSFRLRGYEREKMMLDMERQKLEEAHKLGGIDATRYEQQKAMLAAQSEAAAKLAGERRDELQGALEISKLRRMEEAARARGATAPAEAFRKAAEAREQDMARVAASKEAEGANLSPHARQQYIQQKVEEDRQEREQARQQREKEASLTRAGSRANQGGAVGALKEQLLRMQGRGPEAAKLQESLARRKDEVDREEARQKYLKEGFGTDESKRMADTDVKAAQAQRLVDRLGGSSGTIVASSLQAIGGGGNAFGGDKGLGFLERIAKAVEAVNDPNKDDVDEGTW